MCYDNVILRYSEGKLKKYKNICDEDGISNQCVKMDYLEKNSVGKIV